jgi:hypothetical protein
MNNVPAPQSSFVTGLAWTSILVSAFGAFSSFVQMLVAKALFTDDVVRQLSTVAADDPPVQAMAPWIPRLPMLSFLGFVAMVISLVASIGLLKRIEWARKLFIALLVFGIASNIGVFFLQEKMMAVVAVGGDGDATVAGVIHTARVMTGMLTVVLSVLLAWLAKKLMAPAIVAEFRR